MYVNMPNLASAYVKKREPDKILKDGFITNA